MTFLHIVERDQQTIDDSVHLTKCQIQIGGNRALTRSYLKDNQNSVGGWPKLRLLNWSELKFYLQVYICFILPQLILRC